MESEMHSRIKAMVSPERIAFILGVLFGTLVVGLWCGLIP